MRTVVELPAANPVCVSQAGGLLGPVVGDSVLCETWLIIPALNCVNMGSDALSTSETTKSYSL